ncbi:MAG: ABC transporter permease [Chloroflexi bacterium]|nr:ABC transporter permease [Chloroflexota bacterium]
MVKMRFWLRWSWRDLRARWLQVVAIALIIALGTGVFAGLGGQETWRVASLDASYSRLHMYDLRMELADGSFLDQAALVDTLTGIDGVTTLETRLIVPTLVDASKPDKTVLVQGQLTGVDLAAGGPHINGLFVKEGQGRTLTEADTAQDVVVVEQTFADYYDLKPGDALRISGDVALDFVGAGQSPEYFTVVPENGTFMGEAGLAVLFLPLDTVQRIAGREGLVNDVLFLIDKGADRETVRAEVERRMTAAFASTGIEFMNPEDDMAHKLLYTDAKEDQATWDAVAFLFLIGAALAAFNLAGRIVEAQRRQIGIGMALGVPRQWIAFRPMLVGFQIAVLGTILGLIFGLVLNQLFANLFRDLLPLPYWDIKFYVPGYLRATLLGILIPFVATLIPVWRAVRVAPVDAIRSGYLVAKGGGLSWIANFIPLPGKSFSQMPLKNLLRSPWRSLLTVLGISMAIVLMTAFIGFLDTFQATMDRAEEAYVNEAADRVVVTLDFFYPVENGEISGIRDAINSEGKPLVAQLETGLILGGNLSRGDEEINTLLELHDMDEAIWRPTLLKGHLTGDEPGIIISEKAAEDLELSVGDKVTLEYPRREGVLNFQLVKSEMTVTGIHNNPIRVLSYMDLSGAEMMGLEGATNLLVVKPADGVDADDIKRAMLTQPGVASAQAISEFAKAFDEALDVFVVILRVVQGIVLFMAFLIAFNSTSINVDERVREIATMFAFGLPIRTVNRMQMVENLIIGVLGTIIGIVLGWFVLNLFLAARIEEQLADFKFIVTISPQTLIVSAVLGILVVMITPLLSIGRMWRMDIPSTLRVME